MERKMSKTKIKIPEGIKPKEFFMEFVPKTYHENVKDMDMTEYNGFKIKVQFNITGTDGGEFGFKMMDGVKTETKNGQIDDPDVTLSFDQEYFYGAIKGKFPWIPLEIAFNPESLREEIPPSQAHEELDILEGINGQADIQVSMNDGSTAKLRSNFHGDTKPAVTFYVNEKIIKEIQDEKYTVMEAFMSSKMKVDGPVEFAMHVMALAPEKEDDED